MTMDSSTERKKKEINCYTSEHEKMIMQTQFLKYAKEIYNNNKELGETNFKLYPSEEKKFYLEKRMRLLTLYGGNPCAMVRVGKGKVLILHTFIYET